MTTTIAETPEHAELEPDADVETPADEPEQDGDEDEDEDDEEPEQTQQAPESSAVIEEIGKKLDQLNKHVAKRMGDILGEDAQLYRPCMCSELFQTPGWLPPIDPPPDAQAFMHHWMGEHAISDFKPDNFSRVCDVCGGLGMTATGSQVQGQQTLPCIPCKSLGWVPVGPEREGPGAYTPPTAPQTNGVTATPPIQPVQAADTPEIAALKQAGYTVIAPFPA